MNSSPIFRVAQIASPWISIPPNGYGGTENVIYNLTEALVESGQDVTLFTTGDSNVSAKTKYVYPKALLSSEISWGNIVKARRHFKWAFQEIYKEKKYDIIHVHLSSRADLILFELAAHSPIPVICTLHSRFPFDRRPGNVAKEDKYYLQWANNLPLVAVSEQSKENATNTVSQPLRFIDVITHGLSDDEFFSGEELARNSLVWVGRITPDKGTHFALEASIRTGIPIIFAGIVDKYVKEAVRYFNKKVKPLIDAHPDLITFIGPVNRQERSALLKQGLVFLNPIQWEEPFGLVMIESMAQGCPVISFNKGAALSIVRPFVNGDIACNLNEMIEKIPKVIQRIERKKLITWTKRNYSSRTMAKKYLHAYKKVIRSWNS